MIEYEKPLPVIQPWSKLFWNAARERRLLIQECRNCGKKIFYPKKYCPECRSTDIGWVESSGEGKVYSFSTLYLGVHPKFEENAPYTIAIIELNEGVRLMSNIVNCEPKDIRCDMPVKVTFEDVTEEITLPKFEPKK
jgi:uncharacterized OB-fold protein